MSNAHNRCRVELLDTPLNNDESSVDIVEARRRTSDPLNKLTLQLWLLLHIRCVPRALRITISNEASKLRGEDIDLPLVLRIQTLSSSHQCCPRNARQHSQGRRRPTWIRGSTIGALQIAWQALQLRKIRIVHFYDTGLMISTKSMHHAFLESKCLPNAATAERAEASEH